MIEILLVILVILEVIRLILTIKADRTISDNYKHTISLGKRWNEMCQGIEEFGQQAEWLGQCKSILIDKYGWSAAIANTLDYDSWMEYYKDEMTPEQACREEIDAGR